MSLTPGQVNVASKVLIQLLPYLLKNFQYYLVGLAHCDIAPISNFTTNLYKSFWQVNNSLNIPSKCKHQ